MGGWGGGVVHPLHYVGGRNLLRELLIIFPQRVFLFLLRGAEYGRLYAHEKSRSPTQVFKSLKLDV